jgi:nitrite reductase/ring-hydroxylating ferredoxin subunit
MDTFPILLDGVLYRVPVECTHRGGRLQCGKVDLQRGVIVCPLHFSSFDLRTGRRLGGPACENLDIEIEQGG